MGAASARDRVPARLVDVVIPVHDVSRPIRRAVSSVLDGGVDGRVRVLVVCHGLPVEAIAPQLQGLLENGDVILLPFSDGIRSPAGPFNHGLSAAHAPYVSIMGSDDFLEPGAMAAWIAHVERHAPDVALVRLRYQNGDKLHNPLVRRGRSFSLNVVKDRLFYRTAPLGLLRNALVVDRGFSFTEGLPVGKDMAFSAQLWTAGGRIDYLRDAPCYVIGDDADSRVTTQDRPVAEAMAAVLDLVRRDWIHTLRPSVRRALVTKLTRIHILGAAISRADIAVWRASDAADLRSSAREVVDIAPDAVAPLSRADRCLLDAILDETATAASVVAAVDRHRASGRLSHILPRNPLRLADREGTLARFILYRTSP